MYHVPHVGFRNQEPPIAPVENPIAVLCSPFGLHRRVRHQRGDTLYGVSKNSIYRWQKRSSGVKKPVLVCLTHQETAY